MGIDLKLDFILNHASAQSPQFQNLVKYGEKSEYKDFFINWNEFWKGYGVMTEEGFSQPDDQYLQKMFMRKPELPILMVQFRMEKKVPYWNTFYQEDRYPQYLGQMDLNIKSRLCGSSIKRRYKNWQGMVQALFAWMHLPMHRKNPAKKFFK